MKWVEIMGGIGLKGEVGTLNQTKCKLGRTGIETGEEWIETKGETSGKEEVGALDKSSVSERACAIYDIPRVLAVISWWRDVCVRLPGQLSVVRAVVPSPKRKIQQAVRSSLHQQCKLETGVEEG